jgi:hypothetical protein
MMVFVRTKTLSPCFIRINEVFYFWGGGSRLSGQPWKKFTGSPLAFPFERRYSSYINACKPPVGLAAEDLGAAGEMRLSVSGLSGSG